MKTFSKDKRKPIEKIYSDLSRLDNSWKKEIIYLQRYKNELLPILAFKTLKKGKSLWIISGIHGEEPAGVNAISGSIEFLNKLAKKMPIILLPLCNPVGYARNWRHPYKRRGPIKGIIRSVSSADHLLLNEKGKPRAGSPLCKEAEKIISFSLEALKNYSPLLVLDFHEDESKLKLCIYSQGRLGSQDPVAKQVIGILKKNKFDFYENKLTSFNEKIENGIVSGIKDSSIDEFLASEKIIMTSSPP